MYKPRNYQTQCLIALQNARDQGKRRALMVMASGLGKTLTCVFDIQEYLKTVPNGRILVLCHSAAILTQTKETFKSIFGDEFSYGMYNGYEKAIHQTDFLFANLQSVNLHSDEFAPDEFCYVVVDEAHHSPAETYRKTIEHFTPQFLLGMTATPDRMDDANLSAIFGDTVYEYRLESAVKDGWLSDIEYRIKTDEIQRLEAYLDSGEKFSLAQLNREVFVPKRDEEIVRIIREEISGKDNPTMVIFCQTIAHADKFAELMGDAVVIHSGLEDKVIKERLASFRFGSIKTVCTVDMLNEGIDVPRTDVIVFLRVTQSKIVFTQQLGRGLRRAKGKDKVLVLDFVSTADRLEMLFQFERKFKSAVGRYPRKKNNSEREYFTLNIDAPVFRDRKVDIIALIEKARNYSRIMQQFPEWDSLSADEIWEDVVQRFRDFGQSNGRKVVKSDLGIGDIPSMYFLKKYLGEQITLAEIQDRAYQNARTIWTKEKVDAALIAIADYYGKIPGQKDLRAYARKFKGSVPAMETIQRFFYKNYADAYRQIGYEVKIANLPWPTEKILSGMREVYEVYGHIPTRDQYENYRKDHKDKIPCNDTVRSIDGNVVGWKEAFQIRLGVTDSKLSYDQAIQALKDVASKCEKKSLSIEGYKEYRKAHPEENLPSHWSIQDVLGASTWNEAKEKAGLVTTPWLGH